MQGEYAMTLSNELTTETSPVSSTWIPGNREEKIIDKKLDVFVASIGTLEELAGALSVEVTEISSIKKSFKKELQEALENKVMSMVPELAIALSQPLNERTKQSANTLCGVIQRLQREAEYAEQVIKNLIQKEKLRFIKWGVSLVGVVLLSCFVTASGLFYFFPQHQYVRYEMTLEQVEQIVFGRSLLDNFEKLKPEDQKLLHDAIKFDMQYIAKRSNHKSN